MIKLRRTVLLLAGAMAWMAAAGFAAEDVNALLAAGGDDVVEKVCQSAAASVEAGGNAFVATARTAPHSLRPIMECVYRNTTPEDFDGMVDSAVKTLNAAGE